MNSNSRATSEVCYSTSHSSNSCDFDTSRDLFLTPQDALLHIVGCRRNIVKFKLKGLKDCVTVSDCVSLVKYVVVNSQE